MILMQVTEYQQMKNLEDTYWWHVGRKSIVRQQLKQSLPAGKNLQILNVGCGTGGGIDVLKQFGTVYNIDVSKEAVRLAQAAGHENVELYDGENIPFAKKKFDMIVALDVLEHIKDDSGALQNWNDYLQDDGQLLLTVPAYQWLWSTHDDALHHQRRYTASHLHRLVSVNNYRVKKRSYAIAFSFPLIVGFRLLQGLTQNSRDKAASSYVMLPKPVNSFFTQLLKLEGRILKYTSLPFGTSVLLIAQKNSRP